MRRTTKKQFLKAVECGDLVSLRVLLEKGADPNFKTSHGETPLALALHRRQVDVALLLLESGADPNSAANDGATPLFWASRYGDVSVLKRLIALGANVQAARNGPATPLAIAVSNGHLEVIRLLLASGADPDKPYLGKHLTYFAGTREIYDALLNRRSAALNVHRDAAI